MKYLTLFVIVLLSFTACNSKEKAEQREREQKYKAMKEDYQRKFDSTVKAQAFDSSSPYFVDTVNQKITSIKFEQEIYNFGKMIEGDTLKDIMIYTNTGKYPLIIKNAWGSCGCTQPEFSTEPLAPGKSDTIVVGFNSKNKVGNNTKSIMIDANTNPRITTVQFSVKVKAK
ncbi:MAG: DUF1573 domain-containing protein [Chitinophagales bacterium]|nr:DUF1573 domain-containing protein [Chitinophagales bacterium]